MNKQELIDFIKKLKPEHTYSVSEILNFVDQLEEPKESPIENTIGKILTMFMVDDNTLFDINDVNRILKDVLNKITQERS